MSSIRTKGIGPLVLVVAVLIAFSLVFAPMGYYYNIAGGVVINKVYAQEDGEGEEVVEVTTDVEEEEPTTTTAGDDVVVDEQQPTTEEEEGQQPLSALFFIDSTNGDAVPATFLFEADPGGGTEPYTYSWDFGDGSQTATGEIVTHTFENPGTYDVRVLVTDSVGQTVTGTEQVTVQPSTTTEGQQLPPTNATTTSLLPANNQTNQTISNATIPTNNTVVVNALLSALVALSPQPPSSPLPTNDSLLQEEQGICTDGGGMNMTCPDVIMITRGELLRCWDEEEADRPGSYTEVICPGGEIEIPKDMQQLRFPGTPRGPREMTID